MEQPGELQRGRTDAVKQLTNRESERLHNKQPQLIQQPEAEAITSALHYYLGVRFEPVQGRIRAQQEGI